MAYNRLYGYPSDEKLEKALKECSYKSVFLLDRLPYIVDYARTETKEQQDILHGYLKEAYKDLGYKIISVPAFSVEERVRFILNNR